MINRTLHGLYLQVNDVENWINDQEKMVTADNIADNLPHVVYQINKFNEVC